jgi:hypothetical protein
MSRDVTIQVLDVVGADYPKQMLEKEPLLLRRSEIVKQVKNGSVNITSESQRLAISKTSETYNNDSSVLSSNNIMQVATVNDVQTVYDKVIDASQGFTDITVKYGLIFNQSGTAPYHVTPHGHPAGTTFVSGDLALAPYNQEILVGVEWFADAGDRNGIIPVAGTAPLKGEGYTLYRYDGTGWLPCVLDTNLGISKYRVKVQKDYAYLCSLLNTTDPTLFSSFHKSYSENYYNMIYYPNTPSAGITRSVRFPKMLEIEARIAHTHETINWKMSNFNCGSTAEDL